MLKKRFLIPIVSILAIGIMVFFGSALSSTYHANLIWKGPQTCLQCHEDKAREVHSSVHYQWQGEAPYALNGPPLQGKLKTAVNSYCINILGNWNACSNCHIGLGAKPETTTSISQLQNIDCLVCHQKDYRRKKVNGVFVPDTTNMTITMDQAVKTVHKPTRENCLQCHAKGGGGDNYKRGDLAIAHGNTSDRNFDVHMAKTGANLSCQSCHTVKNHKIAGRGSDLRQTDLNVKMSCSTSNCHPKMLTSKGHSSSDINRHMNKVACQTCHIKSFARNATDTPATEATEIHRDWFKPHLTPSGAIHPTPTLLNNVKPVYKFWNMYSYGYSLGEIISIDPLTGKYPTSRPDGSINDPQSKLYPFKYKTANQPIATRVNKLIPLDTSVYFASGDPHAATKAGLVNMGYSANEPYTFIETDTFQLITHQVMPKEQSLSCKDCHGSAATQMNLKSLGYVMKGSASSICNQCHSYKDPLKMDYKSLHNKHVKDKKIDCSKCHNFSRLTTATQ
ncbi:MAG: hypothetical protein N3A59_08120 [Thermodesulfovibrionales bacterium]|nr:hypothetical protein [Thermodesulfovibrionales bacterium]